jgi:putative methyltransferase (TIGR04325 family)
MAHSIAIRARDGSTFGWSSLRRLRQTQIRAVARLFEIAARFATARRSLVVLRSFPPARACLDFLLGYRRTFSSFSEAQTTAQRFSDWGHAHPEEMEFHRSLAGSLRESDYPVLFYLRPCASRIRRVFDLGGSVGNIFYSYDHFLGFSPELRWVVFDLAENRKSCHELAEHYQEERIEFTTNLERADGADVFLASGSMHYFDRPIYELLSTQNQPPRMVFVNRSPLSRGEDLITVQDNGSYLVPCKIYGRARLVEGMEALGYKLRAEWPAHERSIRVPLYPDVVEPHYAGLYFERVGF